MAIADVKYMRMALTLASKGAGRVLPNPQVGAVIVKNGMVIGKGYHHHFGGPHAEVMAFNDAMTSVDGATLYITLEPCNHEGKTPPCAPLIVKKGIREVFIGMEDPNPLVKTKSIKYLEENGIKVTSGILENKVRQQNEAYIKYIISGLPFCTLKTGMTLDGKIATISGQSRWITGEKSRSLVQKLRNDADAIMVGINTVLIDNPSLRPVLNGRHPKEPLKIILDSHLRIPLTSKVLTENPQLTIVATTDTAEITAIKNIERLGAQVMICHAKENMIDLKLLMVRLGKMDISSLMIEAGSALAFSALREKIVDKMICFIAPKILGGTKAPMAVGGEGIGTLEKAIAVRDMKIKRVGEDIMITGYF